MDYVDHLLPLDIELFAGMVDLVLNGDILVGVMLVLVLLRLLRIVVLRPSLIGADSTGGGVTVVAVDEPLNSGKTLIIDKLDCDGTVAVAAPLACEVAVEDSLVCEVAIDEPLVCEVAVDGPPNSDETMAAGEPPSNDVPKVEGNEVSKGKDARVEASATTESESLDSDGMPVSEGEGGGVELKIC